MLCGNKQGGEFGMMQATMFQLVWIMTLALALHSRLSPLAWLEPQYQMHMKYKQHVLQLPGRLSNDFGTLNAWHAPFVELSLLARLT